MKNPRSGSSQAPRSSATAAKRLKDKYSYWDDSLARREGEYESESSEDELPRPECQYESELRGDEIERLFGSRESRKLLTSVFCSMLDKCTEVEVSRYCVEPRAWFCLPAKSFKIMWVAVHGIDSICVVTGNKDLVRLERELMQPGTAHEYFIHHFWNTIISIVEDIAGPSGESGEMSNKSSKKPFGVALSDELSPDKPCQMLHKSSKKPFGVVSVIGGSNEVREVFLPRYGEKKAIKFLLEEMESGTTFTFEKTTQTAIYVFQHLFRRKFEADDLRAFVLKNDERVGRELKQERELFDIEEVISFINGA